MLNAVHFREQSASYHGVSGIMFRLRSVSQVRRAKERFVFPSRFHTPKE